MVYPAIDVLLRSIACIVLVFKQFTSKLPLSRHPEVRAARGAPRRM